MPPCIARVVARRFAGRSVDTESLVPEPVVPSLTGADSPSNNCFARKAEVLGKLFRAPVTREQAARKG